MIKYKKFIKECENSGQFNYWQMFEIRYGFENGLSIEQIKLYANPKFGSWQMKEIRLGFEQGLTIEQIQVYTDPDFDYEQMEEIRWGLKQDDFTIEQVKVYANPKFSWSQMRLIREFIINNKDMSIDTLKFLIQLEVL